jgi:hypothetical protein
MKLDYKSPSAGPIWFETEQELKDYVAKNYSSCRIKDVQFVDKGSYYFFCYSQKCPRGCCYDGVVKIISAQEYLSILNEERREIDDIITQATKNGEEPFNEDGTLCLD